MNYIDPYGLEGISVGFEGAGALVGFGVVGGIYGNFSHDPSRPWYAGWSSSATLVLGGGAAGSVYGLTGGVNVNVNNSCNVKQLEKGFFNMSRMSLGAFSIGGYRSPDGSVTGGGLTIGPSYGNSRIYGFGGGTYTWTISGGNW